MEIGKRGIKLLSQLEIDSDLGMGAHDITLGPGQTVDGKDVSELSAADGVIMYAGDLQRQNAATGDCATPERINDGLTVASATFTLNKYAEVAFDTPRIMAQIRQFGHLDNNGTGRWKIEGLRASDNVYVTFLENWATRHNADWGPWENFLAIAVTTPIVGMKITCTVADLSNGQNYVNEFEVKY